MTAFSKVLAGKRSKTGNIKDGRRTNTANLSHFGPEAQTKREAARWEAEGFTLNGEGQWLYTWAGEFPVISLVKVLDIIDGKIVSGIFASLDGGDYKETFVHNVHPANVKARLDDIIYELMRKQADIDAPLDWEDDNGFIDVDDFMEGRWVRT
jgi:hypothetical protein